MKHRAGIILLAAVLLASCNNDFGIMDSIQQEEAQDTDSVFYTTSVVKVVKLNNAYYAQMAGIWKRDATSGSSWSAVSGGGLPSSYACTGLAVAGSKLYACLYGEGVYESDDGGNWTKLSDSSFDGKNIDAIFSANGTLFLEDHDENDTDASDNSAGDIYTLYYLDGSGALANTGINAQTGVSFRGLAYAEGHYWVMAGTTLFTGASESSLSSASESGQPSGVTLTAIYANGDNLYIGTETGSIYRRLAGGTWNSTDIADSSVMALAVVPTGSSSYRLLVGFGGTTDYEGAGYYELTTDLASSYSGDSGLLSTETVYDTTLSDISINEFYYDVDEKVLFAAAAASGSDSQAGLYSNGYDGSSWAGWESE